MDIEKSVPLLQDVSDLELSINELDVNLFNEVINRTWVNKKKTSPYICENPILVDLDNRLMNDDRILSHKLCGAGNGGYFLIFTDRGFKDELLKDYKHIKKISFSETGIESINLNYGFKKV